MNKLVKFENTSIDVQIINGIPMFELYAVGMALGQIKVAKGKAYPRKDRIDENVKNAEIKPVVRNGQLYITESQIYDLMLETKTDKCRAFRKWLTNEVLPELNKTGTYSTPKAKAEKQLEIYNYVEKTYGGIPVMTVADVKHFTDLDEYKIRHIIKSIGKMGQDYYLLKDKNLLRFKSENKMLYATYHSIILITQSGFIAICEHYGIMVDSVMPKALETVDRDKTCIKPSSSMKSAMELVRRECNAILGLSYLMTTLDSRENLKLYRKNMLNHIETLRGLEVELIKI